MSRAILTDGNRLIIPEDVCADGGLKIGEAYEIVRNKHGMFFIPLPPMDELAGMLNVSDTNIDREGH